MKLFTSFFSLLLLLIASASAWPYETLLNERQILSTTIEGDPYTFEVVDIEDHTGTPRKVAFTINGQTLPKLLLHDSYIFDEKLIVNVLALSSNSVRVQFVAEQLLTFEEGERRSITLGTQSYDIEVMLITGDPTVAVFNINGARIPDLERGQTYTFPDSMQLRIKNFIFGYSEGGSDDLVVFSFSNYCGDYYCATSREHCGSCSADCGCPEDSFCTNQVCSAVSCGDGICASGETCPVDNCCVGEETNLSTIANCGVCGMRCLFGEICSQGNCTALCDGRPCPTSNDADNDTISDGIDLCNETPEGCAVTRYGCPKEDVDGDGICDTLDTLEENNASSNKNVQDQNKKQAIHNKTLVEQQDSPETKDWLGLFFIFFILGVIILTVFFLIIRH